GQIDLQYLVPGTETGVLQWHRWRDYRGTVQQAVESAELVGKRLGQLLEFGLYCDFQIKWNQCRLGSACCFNGIVSLFKLAFRSSQQNDRGTMARITQCCRLSKTRTCASHHDYFAVEQVGWGLILEH